jgi:ligand-binding sensor domain-containing protein/signal transduction histidine kinase
MYHHDDDQMNGRYHPLDLTPLPFIINHMMRHRRPLRQWALLLTLLWGLFLVTARPTRAEEWPNLQPPEKENLRFEHLSLEQGLSQSSVLSVYQDTKGYMWFGTLDGLNKYDGYNFTIYEHDPEDPTSLSDNIVQVIFEDRYGNLWFGTHDGGLNRFNRETETFTQYQYDPADPHSLGHNEVTGIVADRSDFLWVATNGGGLNKFNPATDNFTRYQHESGRGMTLGSNFLTQLYKDANGLFWVGTADAGLDKFDPVNRLITHFTHDPEDAYSLSSNQVTAVYKDRTGVLWVGTNGGGLNKYDAAAGQFINYQHQPRFPYSINGNDIVAIQEDYTGALWIAVAGKGLDLFDRENELFIHYQYGASDPNSLNDDTVLSLYADRSGILWIGTEEGGVNKYDVGIRSFILFQHNANDANSLISNAVSAIQEDTAGNIWIGTDQGVSRFNRENGRFTHYQYNPANANSLSNNDILDLHEDHLGNLWIGTADGLNKFNGATEQFTIYRHVPEIPFSLSHNFVTSIYEDRAGFLWIGTSVGLDKFNQDTGQFFHYQHAPGNPDSLSPGAVGAIFEDGLGNLWVGTSSGLDSLEQATGEFTHYQYDANDPLSLSDNTVLSIYEDTAGELWIGTYGGGLNRFNRNNQTFTHFRERHGLANNTIYGILEDDEGYLWVSTNKGLSRFNPQTSTFINYDIRDGLQSNEFTPNAYYKSDNGEMFFGGINGFNVFQPPNIRDNPYVPPVVLTKLTQSGERIEAAQSVDSLQEVVLHWPNNFFEFEFAALSYTQSEKNQYAYMLEGLEDDWNYIGTQPFGRYTNLPGGTYTLRIKGSNNDGIWNEEGTALRLTVIPPFWATWWFRSLIMLLLVVGAASGYRLRVAQIKARTRELERQVGERTRALAQRTAESERRRQIAEGLREILVILNSNRSLAESLDYIVRQAAQLTDADEVVLFRQDESGHLTVAAHSSRGRINGSLTACLPLLKEQWLAQQSPNERPLLITDLGNYPQASNGVLPRLNRYNSLLGVPLTVGQALYGGIAWFYTRERPFYEEDIELGFTFADQATLAIANDHLRSQAEETAVMMERNRLARDLHDAVTQTLFSASLIAEVLPATWDKDQQKGEGLLRELRLLNRGAVAEMRTLLLELRPSALVETKLSDLLKQLGETVTGRTGTAVVVTCNGPCQLPAHVHETLYRIAQEACNNIVKHADATQVEICLTCTPGKHATIYICDNGIGFDPDEIRPDRLGLSIMRERVQVIGAKLTINSQPGRNTEVTVTWQAQ